MMSVEQITCVTLWLDNPDHIHHVYMSFFDMIQGDNVNIKELMGITSLIDLIAIYLIYCCIIVFCLYTETALYNTKTR